MHRRSALAVILQTLGIPFSKQTGGASDQPVNLEGKWRVKDYRLGVQTLAEAGTVVFTKTGFDHQFKNEKPGRDDMTHSGTYKLSGNRLDLTLDKHWHNDPNHSLDGGFYGMYVSYEFSHENGRIVLKGKCVLEKMS
jgi:hypothetical protein